MPHPAFVVAALNAVCLQLYPGPLASQESGTQIIVLVHLMVINHETKVVKLLIRPDPDIFILTAYE